MALITGNQKHLSPDSCFNIFEQDGIWQINRTIPFTFSNLFPGFVDNPITDSFYIENNYNVSYSAYHKYICSRVDVICYDGKERCLQDILSSFVLTLNKTLGQDGYSIFFQYFSCLDDAVCLQTFWDYYSRYTRTEYQNDELIEELLGDGILIII